MNGLDLIYPIDAVQLQQETERIYDVCNGCRRCFNLCPSFNTLLDGIDRVEGIVDQLAPIDYHRVADECYYCKLCYNHCPYTPPHQYALDFPHLMIAWKKHLARTRGVSWRDWMLIKTDVIGALGSRVAWLDRASASGAEGHRFKSCQAHQQTGQASNTPISSIDRPGGPLAQLVEQLTLNQRAVGSIPTRPTKYFNSLDVFSGKRRNG